MYQRRKIFIVNQLVKSQHCIYHPSTLEVVPLISCNYDDKIIYITVNDREESRWKINNTQISI